MLREPDKLWKDIAKYYVGYLRIRDNEWEQTVQRKPDGTFIVGFISQAEMERKVEMWLEDFPKIKALNMSIKEVLDTLAEQTGYPWEITPYMIK